MANEVVLPLMGEGVVEAQIGRWLKAVGDAVEEGEPIVEVETDKVTTELESDFDGVLLEIRVPEGETAELDQVLAVIGAPGEGKDEGGGQKDEGELSMVNGQSSIVNGQPENSQQSTVISDQSTVNSQQSTTADSQSTTPSPQPPAPSPQSEYSGRISPVVKRMMKEHDLDLSRIEGTGKNGRITKRDVDAYLKDEGRRMKDEELSIVDSQSSIVNDRSPTTDHRPPIRHSPIPADTDLVPHSNMRRRIAEHMVMSKRESPHATTVFEIDFEAVAQHRAAQKAEFAKRGVKLTYMAYIGLAVVQALQQVPDANAQWHEEGIVRHRAIHLGMATAVDNGLIVPVIKNADTLNLLGMATAVEDLAQRGRAGKLQAADMQGGTFTLTNHGVFGSLFATPIINQPQSGILGIGTIEKRVCVVDDMIAIRRKAFFSLSFDHRILDGADADRFLQIVKQTLEGWHG